MATRLLYTRADGRWAWRLTADNGQIIATDGGQGYSNEKDARAMADAVIGGAYRDADKRIIRPTT
ncbi:hypothetical protein CTKZ_08330 [Cellulomonas algicola]|uniref:DUF1508 domain-containing protein n=1 Tax=Cellulomonas algicola TaxID=2071633 RepID=A0A401UX71_9CELL|nr:YegP family protein [Cellulomonas algicola]GCD19271.1 hypothetical protein CTKZ_08330 [Cellulomonas algicola]